jgi:ATP-dependent Lon protease
MKESLVIARLNALNFLNDEEKKILLENNIHVHFGKAGLPKEGTSAGAAICAALLSLAKGVPVDPTLAICCELSLNGEIQKISK